jgi:hypothetical protein
MSLIVARFAETCNCSRTLRIARTRHDAIRRDEPSQNRVEARPVVIQRTERGLLAALAGEPVIRRQCAAGEARRTEGVILLPAHFAAAGVGRQAGAAEVVTCEVVYRAPLPLRNSLNKQTRSVPTAPQSLCQNRGSVVSLRRVGPNNVVRPLAVSWSCMCLKRGTHRGQDRAVHPRRRFC